MRTFILTAVTVGLILAGESSVHAQEIVNLNAATLRNPAGGLVSPTHHYMLVADTNSDGFAVEQDTDFDVGEYLDLDDDLILLRGDSAAGVISLSGQPVSGGSIEGAPLALFWFSNESFAGGGNAVSYDDPYGMYRSDTGESGGDPWLYPATSGTVSLVFETVDVDPSDGVRAELGRQIFQVCASPPSSVTLTTPADSAFITGAFNISYTLPSLDAALVSNPLQVIFGPGTGSETTLNLSLPSGLTNTLFGVNPLDPASHPEVLSATGPIGIGGEAVQLSFLSICGPEPITASSTNVIVDAVTLPPTLISPTNGMTIMLSPFAMVNSGAGDTPLPIEFTLPETPATGTVTVTFTPSSGGTPIHLVMNDNLSQDFDLNQADPAADSAVVALMNATAAPGMETVMGVYQTSDWYAIPPGIYDIELAYQDLAGNAAASTTAFDVELRQQCRPGTASPSPPSYGFDDCDDCVPGQFTSSAGQSTCQDCGPGTFQADFGATDCDDCDPGTAAGGFGLSECSACGDDSVAPSASAMSCVQCDPGEEPNMDHTMCVDCLAGFFSTDGSPCKPCPAGTAQPMTGQSSCIPCVPGTFASASQLSMCATCPDNTYTPVSGSLGCAMCPAGSFANAAHDGCTLCGAGEFADTVMGSCQSCAPGQYAAGQGNASCLNCPAGTFSMSGASASCSPCPAGSAAAETGSMECTACAAGTYAPAGGQSECLACPTGTASEAGATECTPSMVDGGVDGGDGEGGGGGGCHVSSTQSPFATAVLGLLAIVVTRRRRSRA